MSADVPNADGDLRMDWSDADLYSFLETLGTSYPKQQESPMLEPGFQAPEQFARATLISHNSESHSGDSSSGGRPDQGEYAAGPQGQGLRASNSGEQEAQPQRGLSIKKSSCERDKNKVAQRAFRQRKKEREKAKEQQLEELMEKLEIAGQEREQLARHNALLEKAIIARDRVSADFKEAKIAGGGSYGLEEPKKPGRILRPSRHWENNLDWTTDDTLQLTLGEHNVQWELKGSDVADMSIDYIKPPWKALVNKLAAALVEAEKEADGKGPATDSITLLVAETVAIPAFLARLSPLQIHKFATSRLGDVPFGPKTASPALWRSIMVNMELRLEQKMQLLQLRRQLMETMSMLLQERRMIQALIKDVEGTMSMNKEDVTLKIWQLQEAVHRLRINVRTVHDSKCRLFSTAWRQVLQPIQGAKLLVQAFPFPADLLSVISTLVEEAGEPAAMELLAARAVAPSLSSFQQPVVLQELKCSKQSGDGS